MAASSPLATRCTRATSSVAERSGPIACLPRPRVPLDQSTARLIQIERRQRTADRAHRARHPRAARHGAAPDPLVAGRHRRPAGRRRGPRRGRARRRAPRHRVTDRVGRRLGDRPRPAVRQDLRHRDLRHQRQACPHRRHPGAAGGVRRRARHRRHPPPVAGRGRHRPVRRARRGGRPEPALRLGPRRPAGAARRGRRGAGAADRAAIPRGRLRRRPRRARPSAVPAERSRGRRGGRGRGRHRALAAEPLQRDRRSSGHHPPPCRRSGRRRACRCGAGRRGRDAVHHAQCRVLPHRHRTGGTADPPRLVEARRRWDGRPTVHPQLPGPARPPPGRAGPHPGLRLQRGRRPLHRHRPLARRAAARRPAWRPASSRARTSW